MTKKIIILNHANGSVHIFPFDEYSYDDESDFFNQEFIEELGISQSNSQWMIVDELSIKIH